MSDTSLTQSKTSLKSYLPFLIILGGLAFAILQGWHKELTPEGLKTHSATLSELVKTQFWLILPAFIAVYALCTAFMVPASILTVAGGFLFGAYIGAPAVVIGATIGACILFWAAKTSLGISLKKIAGPFISKMETGFNKSPMSYMFSLRPVSYTHLTLPTILLV